MLPFKKVLFPVDYSERNRSVVPHVREMVSHFAMPLTLLHTYGVSALPYTDLAVADPDWPEVVRAREEKFLREFAAQSFPGEKVDCIVSEGDAASAIDKTVRQQGIDLVMLPTHGRGPVRRFLLGSVTAKVLHDVSAAVWTSADHKGGARIPSMPYKSILCAVDFSEETEAVIRAAKSLADSYGARLALLHVVELPPPSVDVDFTAFRQDLVDAGNDQLRRWKDKLGLDIPHKCIDGMAVDCVCQEALEWNADLVVVGRGQAQGTFSRIWSRLYAIARESPCPVLSL
jgi:nucleotide-binding universal stress UspA family protein